ncbi:hypothetical protein ACH33_15775 [Aneurinibacillus sp. XH2]|uniref:hypothetical protein n=1 Tax=Aneurinibacillus sp. XH2 TaxID=1450761 RepID=UPI00070935CA|nr:hypothetical protein [Aneurinibacillus sp. XH2]AMA74132.1 hypothetical protein ACH33_15775 [Aneurinibacillus sp. XH2]
MERKIRMDLLSDWHDEMIKEMIEEGLQFSQDSSKDSLIIKYFAYLRKKGGQIPRKVYKSKEFNCPPKHEKGLANLIHKLETGEDLAPYLSKQVKKLNHDGMFNDWGVLHFHLGEKMEGNSKYIERTGPLLYAVLRENAAYLINVLEHQNWTNRDILQTIYRNWPELISPYKIAGDVRLAYNYTEKQHQQLRNAGVVVMVELEEENGEKFVVAPPGMGIVTSGHSMNDVKLYQREANLLRTIEDQIKNDIISIEQAMKEQQMATPETYNFKLIHEDGKWKVREENTGYVINFET